MTPGTPNKQSPESVHYQDSGLCHVTPQVGRECRNFAAFFAEKSQVLEAEIITLQIPSIDQALPHHRTCVARRRRLGRDQDRASLLVSLQSEGSASSLPGWRTLRNVEVHLSVPAVKGRRLYYHMNLSLLDDTSRRGNTRYENCRCEGYPMRRRAGQLRARRYVYARRVDAGGAFAAAELIEHAVEQSERICVLCLLEKSGGWLC